MMPVDAPRARTPRSDGEQSRARLMQAALRLFAMRGYENTSTREIAESAGTNVAAISYHYGDKAGLYRAVFAAVQGVPPHEVERFADPANTLREALEGMYRSFVEPLGQGDLPQLCMKLHLREMIEPTGLWPEDVRRAIEPLHRALLGVLGRALGLKRADDELRRLAICIAALGVHLHVGREVVDVLAPRLQRGPKALGQWLERLVMYAEAMVEAERTRRDGGTT